MILKYKASLIFVLPHRVLMFDRDFIFNDKGSNRLFDSIDDIVYQDLLHAFTFTPVQHWVRTFVEQGLGFVVDCAKYFKVVFTVILHNNNIDV
jgi:hypothetical protein